MTRAISLFGPGPAHFGSLREEMAVMMMTTKSHVFAEHLLNTLLNALCSSVHSALTAAL